MCVCVGVCAMKKKIGRLILKRNAGIRPKL